MIKTKNKQIYKETNKQTDRQPKIFNRVGKTSLRQTLRFLPQAINLVFRYLLTFVGTTLFLHCWGEVY